MPTSQNGWAASPDKRAIGVVPFTVAGVTFPGGVKADDIATVLTYVAMRFHTVVEPLKVGWCWGWAYRDVRAGTSLSNHASGTAIDVNAPAHPLGTQTFSQSQRDAIRMIMAECDGVVRWGGDYAGRKDEMHFEINKGAAAVAVLANKIRHGAGQGDDMSADGEATLLERTKQLVEIFDDYYAAKKAKYGEAVAMRHGAGRALYDLEEVIGSFYAAASAARGKEWADKNTFGTAMFRLYDQLVEE